jgi:hypothetical protein
MLVLIMVEYLYINIGVCMDDHDATIPELWGGCSISGSFGSPSTRLCVCLFIFNFCTNGAKVFGFRMTLVSGS